MQIIYPKEIDNLWDSIPDKYWNDEENAPKEIQERMALWRKKACEYDEEVRKELFGF